MGSGESTNRRVSFGLDEDDRVRILRGVKLSKDVLQRMRTVHVEPRTPTSNKENQDTQAKTTSFPEEVKQRYEQQQAIIQEELAHIALKEKEEARQDITRALQRERVQTRQEAEKAKQLGKQLDRKEAELKALEAFYKEQLIQLEKKNEDRFRASAEQFHAAATRNEASIKPRNMEPVCVNLQAQILNCYRENRAETLQCSDLAKEYMQCISAAKKNLFANY